MSTEDTTAAWAESIIREVSGCQHLTVGLISGARYGNDARCVNQLVSVLASRAKAAGEEYRLLCVRLAVMSNEKLEQPADQTESVPPAMRSPLGPWSEVTIPVPVGARASWSLLQIPTWLSAWKEAFRLILVDVGPINLVPSRIVGRLCDVNYLHLGPEECASSDWLLEHMAWHDRSGSKIVGSLLSGQQAAA